MATSGLSLVCWGVLTEPLPGALFLIIPAPSGGSRGLPAQCCTPGPLLQDREAAVSLRPQGRGSRRRKGQLGLHCVDYTSRKLLRKEKQRPRAPALRPEA